MDGVVLNNHTMKWQGTGNEIRHGIYLTKGVHNVLCKTWIDPNSLKTVPGLVPFSGLYLVQMEAKFCFCCFTPAPGQGQSTTEFQGRKWFQLCSLNTATQALAQP